MSFTESIKTCFQKYIDFSGRASRSEYWWFFLFTLIVRILTGWIPGVGFVVTLVLLLPSLSATVRRLHDTNRTGWWLLMPIGITIAAVVVGVILSFVVGPFLGVGIAVLGSIAGFVSLLMFLVQPGDPQPNQYGPNPLLQGTGGAEFGGAGNPYVSPSADAEFTSPSFDSEPSVFRRNLLRASSGATARSAADGSACLQLQADARFCTTCGTSV